MAHKPKLRLAVHDIAVSLFYQAQHLRNLAELDSERIARRLDRLRRGLVHYGESAPNGNGSSSR